MIKTKLLASAAVATAGIGYPNAVIAGANNGFSVERDYGIALAVATCHVSNGNGNLDIWAAGGVKWLRRRGWSARQIKNLNRAEGERWADHFLARTNPRTCKYENPTIQTSRQRGSLSDTPFEF